MGHANCPFQHISVCCTWRFELIYGLGAITALIHDVIITLGFFSLFNLTFDLSVLAAVLAVIGYSLNDSIAVFDRIRENNITLRKLSILDVLDKSINQTLIATLVTSLTTLLVNYIFVNIWRRYCRKFLYCYANWYYYRHLFLYICC